MLTHLGGPVGTDLLAVLCLAAAWSLFLGAARLLIPKALTPFRPPWLRTAATPILGTLTADALTAFSFFGAFMTIAADTTHRSVHSPDFAQRLLIVDSKGCQWLVRPCTSENKSSRRSEDRPGLGR